MLSNTSLSIARYRFTLQFEHTAKLNSYAGSALRGCFGHGLRSVSCITKQKECTHCPLVNSCQYPALFEPKPSQTQQQFSSIPAPYIIEVDNTPREIFNKGETLNFNMVLFGDAIKQLSIIILAWQRAAFHGIGKGKARASLTQVAWQKSTNNWQTIYSQQQPNIIPHQATIVTPKTSQINKVNLTLLTPTRIQVKGKLQNSQQLQGHHFLRNLARKVSLYLQNYCQLHKLTAPELANLSLKANTTMQKWTRYSNRQQTKMHLDGLIGNIELTGDLTHWLPWLWLGQYTHIGKNTSFGLGHYKIERINYE